MASMSGCGCRFFAMSSTIVTSLSVRSDLKAQVREEGEKVVDEVSRDVVVVLRSDLKAQVRAGARAEGRRWWKRWWLW
jgi:hypothetical protein